MGDNLIPISDEPLPLCCRQSSALIGQLGGRAGHRGVGVWRSFAELAKPGAEIAHTQMELTNMSNELIRPIDPDTAHAIEETAKFGTKLLDSGDKAAGYAAGVVKRLPHNLVGIIGDWVYHKRIRRWAELQAETKRILDERGVKEPYEDPSPSIALPLIEAAIDETRENLKEIWRSYSRRPLTRAAECGCLLLSLLSNLRHSTPLY